MLLRAVTAVATVEWWEKTDSKARARGQEPYSRERGGKLTSHVSTLAGW